MNKFTHHLSRLLDIKNWLLVFLVSALFYPQYTQAQNTCLTSFNPNNSLIRHANGDQLCLLGNLLCLDGQTSSELQKSMDGNFNTYSEWNNLVTLLSYQGLSFRAKNQTTYAANTVGAKISLNGTVNLNLFADFYFGAYNNGQLVKGALVGGLLTSSSLLSNEQSFYIYLDSLPAFDEVRIFKLSALGLNNNFRLHEVFMFNTSCIAQNTNEQCLDYIQGLGTYVTAGGGLLSGVGGSIIGPNKLNNSVSYDYATLNYLANTANLNIGVADLNHIYNVQNNMRVGVVIEPKSSSIINLDLISLLSIKTYLYGEETGSYTYSPTNNLLSLNALTSAESDKKQKISFDATAPFNEVRLHINGLSASVNGAFNIYGFYVEPRTCSDCQDRVNTATNAAVRGEVMDGNNTWTGRFGLNLLGGAVTNSSDVTNTNFLDYATFNFGLSINGGCRLTVDIDETLPGGTFAGYEIGSSSGLLDLSVFETTKIKTYLGDVLQEEISQSALASLSLITVNVNNNRNILGFTTSTEFDRVMIEVNSPLAVLQDLRIYNLVIVKDSDNDGFPDCIDNYDECHNAFDYNNNGIPDECDYADIVTTIELMSNVTKFNAADTLEYRVKVQNLGPLPASNVDVNIPTPIHTAIPSWTATTTTGLTLPQTSGSGSINQIIDSFPVNATATYNYLVIPDSNYAAPSISASVTSNSSPNPPDLTIMGDILSTPPLPFEPFPDLELSLFMNSGIINANTPLKADLIINEINGTPSNGQITIAIAKVPNFTVALENRTMALNNIDTTNFNSWEVDNTSNNNYHFIKIKPQNLASYQVEKGKSVYIPIIINMTQAVPNIDLQPVIPRIRNFSGGEVNSLNNDVIIYKLINMN